MMISNGNVKFRKINFVKLKYEKLKGGKKVRDEFT